MDDYEDFVTGNLEAARKAYELWAQTYPRDDITPTNLAPFTPLWETTTGPSLRTKRR
ncbi:MAG: hypothetical protein WB630_14980 [Candidatus Acidiferrales bacterium]